MSDAFEQNIAGVTNLVTSGENKVNDSDITKEEGVDSEYIDVLDLKKTDEELLELAREWKSLDDGYSPKITPRQKRNRMYYSGLQLAQGGTATKPVSSNLLFEAEETFIPQALAKNPEPVVFSDNTEEGKEASNDIKTMLQYHADILHMRSVLGVMVRDWSIYFTAIVKYGWDDKKNDVCIEKRKPQNFIFDPDAFIDPAGNYIGEFLGERMTKTGRKLIKMFPKHKEYITEKCAQKLGTKVTYTEWWTDEFCFTTFEDVVLDKHKNEFFNYEQTETKTDEFGLPEETVTPAKNHFAIPQMPFTFLSVFSLQEQPHDITNLIEQNLANQDRITERDIQITKNLASGNNGVVLSGQGFNVENASQVVQSFYEEGFILNPSGVKDAVYRIPASALPSGVLEAQANDKETLRSVFGTLGISAQKPNEEDTARGMILNQSHDTSRIGGGIGDRLEEVADTMFNWLLQLYFVFYDEAHYGAIMGNGRAVEYVKIVNSDINRNFVVSISPNSMKPKDEVSEQNLAVERWNNKAIDPIGLMKALNEPDPMESAKRLCMWVTNPQLYMMTYFPESAPPVPDSNNPQLPEGSPQPIPEGQDPNLAQDPASSSLSAVPINTPAIPQ